MSFIHKDSFLKAILPYSIFLIPVLIKVLIINSINFGVEIIPFDLHWKSVMMNEPDDISTLFYLLNSTKTLFQYSFLSFFAVMIIYFKVGINKRKYEVAFLILLLVPICTVVLALYEKYLYLFFPDFLNDFIMILELRRAWGLIPIIALPVTIDYVYNFVSKSGLLRLNFFLKKIKNYN